MSDLGNKEVFSKNLNFYMRLHKKDRTKVAKDLGLNYSTVRDWTNGRAYPRIDKIELLANYFDIPKSKLIEQDGLLVEGESDKLFFNYIIGFSKDKIEEELLIKCTMLDSDYQKKLLELANLFLKEQGDFAELQKDGKWIIIDNDKK